MARQRKQWYIIELSEYGEVATFPEKTTAIQNIFGQSVDFFIPTHHEKLGDYISVNTLFDGYVFVKDSEEVKENFGNLREHKLFTGLLKSAGKVRTLETKDITKLKNKLKKSLKKRLTSGVRVKVHDGIFENLEGEIKDIDAEGKIANVCIQCLSREIIAPIPVTCLEKI